MTKTTVTQFKLFKKAVLYWLDRLKLDDWTTYFSHEELASGYSEIAMNVQGRVATIRFNTVWQDYANPINDKEIWSSAKHEVIHLLIYDLEALGIRRFTSEEAITIETEKLVIKLMECIS